MMARLYKIHIFLGFVVAIPVLAWATSGLLYALPNTVEGGAVSPINAASVKISPCEAISQANKFADKELPLTALTLLMRDKKPFYQAVGGMGMDSLLIDAETGVVTKTPPPGILTRYFRQAHFYFFAGSLQVPLLVLVSALSALSAATGLFLAINWLRRPSSRI